MEGLAGHELEGYGQRMFGHMRLSCFHRLNQARLIELQPGGAYSPSEHVEFDYLIPRDNVCLVVETTGRRGPVEVRRKDDRLRRHYNSRQFAVKKERIWCLLGVPEEGLSNFRSVTQLRRLFITTKLEKFDVNLAPRSPDSQPWRFCDADPPVP